MPKRNNPQTSKDAHDSLKQEDIREMYRRILEALRLIKEGTWYDLSIAMKEKPERIWKRLSELREMGLIYRPMTRKLLPSGRTGFTWRIVGDETIVPTAESFPKGKTAAEFAKSIIQSTLF